MDNSKKIKVVWLCHFSDSELREHLVFRKPFFQEFLHKLIRRPFPRWDFDFANWNRNAINCFANFEDIDLTVVLPHRGLKGYLQNFYSNRIHYVCFRSEDESPFFFVKRCLGVKKYSYKKNRKRIKKIISEIKPSIIHIIGAENPYYSICAFDIPKSIISIVSLETFISAKDFNKDYSTEEEQYKYRSDIEQKVIKCCDYVATNVTKFREEVRECIGKDISFLDLPLALGVEIDTVRDTRKNEYDFVYFAADIRKAADDAIEAFAIAKHIYPEITLNISGGFSLDNKDELDKRIEQLGIAESIFFTGLQPSHTMVVSQIQKSRFALLPFKVDLMPSTVREAMAAGLPVITTSTELTLSLNEKRKSVLLSEKGDHQSLAENMISLIRDKELSELLVANAFKTVSEKYSNSSFMEKWRTCYHALVKE